MSLMDEIAAVVRARQIELGEIEQQLELPNHDFCTGCQQNRPILDFFTKTRSYRQCISCRSKDYLKNMYIPYPQTNYCESCGDKFTGDNPSVTDHLHGTNIFRGYLCNRCNPGIGMFLDSIDRLQQAIDYLKFKTRKELFPHIPNTPRSVE